MQPVRYMVILILLLGILVNALAPLRADSPTCRWATNAALAKAVASGGATVSGQK